MQPVLAADAHRALALATAALRRPRAPVEELPARLLLVDVERQRLVVIQAGEAVGEYVVSTAAAGVGGAAGSLRTPPGWHRIAARIGEGAAIGTVFRSREATGDTWGGEPRDEDMILTRILWLDGLEEGVNRGPGCDSRERYIYLHGTNQESLLGTTASGGCIRMRNADIVELFEAAQPGDSVLVVDLRLELAQWLAAGRFHYAGIGGSGMSALAQFQVMRGGRASGSDRAFDRGERADARARLEAMGIEILPQDGSGPGRECLAVVVSTAVEESVPDVASAWRHRVPIVHRSTLLAHFAASHRTIGVAGTSGKSTVVAMVFEILRGAGRDPSVITGGDLVVLQREGLWGNAWAGGSDLLVIEADESDGSLVRYSPAVGVVLNLQRDHREMDEVARMFAEFRRNTREAFVCGEEPNLGVLAPGARVFGTGGGARVRGTDLELLPGCSAFRVDGTRFELPVPGAHNVANALAAIAACGAVGVAVPEMVGPLSRFQGVGRRFQVIGAARGVEVIDDFAHNPAKLAAAIATAQRRAGRVLAVYQPHGFGPTRFLRGDFVDTFSRCLRPGDRLWLLDIFYAGGTATRDVAAADIARDIAARGTLAEFAPGRDWLASRIAGEARSGDLVLVMGARDPSLTTFARDVLERLALEPSHRMESQ